MSAPACAALSQGPPLLGVHDTPRATIVKRTPVKHELATARCDGALYPTIRAVRRFRSSVFMASPDVDLDALRVLLADRYVIGTSLGRGGMGAVYLARDLQLDRPVAIKVLPSEFAAQPDLRERFLRETRTAAGFSHPNIVPVFAVEDRGAVLAMAMGYVEGESVAERVTRAGPLTVKEAVRLLQDVGYALAYAHGRGVVHRDIKPDNIMLERATGRALVMDFGISRTIAAAPSSAQAGLTRVGEVVGTPEFMSPEQASGDHVDGRSDLYSLGLVAWYAVTGAYAISGDTTQKVLVKQLTETLPPVTSARADLPVPLAAAIDRLLRKDPNERFATAESLVEAIDAAQLSAPEVPLPVRLFQQSGQGYLVNAGLVVALAVMNYVRSEPEATIDRLATISVGFALEFVLLTTIARQARTLRRQGFDHAALRRGLTSIMEEGHDARAQALSVPGVSKRRRVRLIIAPLLFVMGLFNVRYAFALRVEYKPGYFSMSRVAVTIAISGMCSVVVAAMLVAIDPYRRPLLQRIANAIWGGPIGAFLMGSGSATAPASAPSLPRARVPRVVANGPVTANGRLDHIERRLAALEQMRASQSQVCEG